MPVHDGSRVKPDVFDDFHCRWIVTISDALNGGLLPPNFYAMAEKYAGAIIPDVLALQAGQGGMTNGNGAGTNGHGTTAVADAPPRVRMTARSANVAASRMPRSVVVRSAGDDRVVALVEIVSPGNKSSREALGAFVAKAVGAMARGWHLLVLDLHAPSRRDPQGLHGAIWKALARDKSYLAPADLPLTLAAYAAEPDSGAATAYIEPVAVGSPLPEMPLFLEPGAYVNVPLEATYQAAWRGVPRRWKGVIEPAD